MDIGLPRMQLLTIYIIKAICLSFPFLLPFTCFPLLFSFFPLSTSFSLPLSLQMGYLASEKEESCASYKCTTEVKRRKSFWQQWELESFVGYAAETQYRGADIVQVLCVCVCLGEAGVKQSSISQKCFFVI